MRTASLRPSRPSPHNPKRPDRAQPPSKVMVAGWSPWTQLAPCLAVQKTWCTNTSSSRMKCPCSCQTLPPHRQWLITSTFCNHRITPTSKCSITRPCLPATTSISIICWWARTVTTSQSRHLLLSPARSNQFFSYSRPSSCSNTQG